MIYGIYLSISDLLPLVWASLVAQKILTSISMGFPAGSEDKESACNARDLGLIPGSGSSPGEVNGY